MRRVKLRKERESLGEACLITSLLGKAKGLMFTLRPKTLIFASDREEHVPLHMWFVFYPIDVLYLDKKKRIIEVKEGFLPFTVHIPEVRSWYVVELPKGSVKKHGLEVGDLMHF